MIRQGVIEECPINVSAMWTWNIVAPKSDGNIKITMDVRNVNRTRQLSNLPIPRHEDIKAKISNAVIFSKLDFQLVF